MLQEHPRVNNVQRTKLKEETESERGEETRNMAINPLLENVIASGFDKEACMVLSSR